MKQLLLAVLALFSTLPQIATAQDWPSARSVRVIVPFPAGGSTDVAARLIADFVSRRLNQTFYVENIGGAGGNVGIDAAAKGTPDGYTILIAPDSIVSSPHVFKVFVDPFKEFEPVIQLTRQPVVFVAHPSLGVKTLADVVRLAKEKPEGLNYATSGAGSQQHIVAEWFSKLAGIKLVHVPYRGGGAAINDLVGGHVRLASMGSTPIIPHYEQGRLQILAQSMKSRAPDLPNVPTYGEAGFPDIVLDQWLGVFVRKATPAPVIAKLSEAISAALADPDIRAKLAKSALEPVGGSSADFAKLLRVDYDKYARLVKDLDIKVGN